MSLSGSVCILVVCHDGVASSATVFPTAGEAIEAGTKSGKVWYDAEKDDIRVFNGEDKTIWMYGVPECWEKGKVA